MTNTKYIFTEKKLLSDFKLILFFFFACQSTTPSAICHRNPVAFPPPRTELSYTTCVRQNLNRLP